MLSSPARTLVTSLESAGAAPPPDARPGLVPDPEGMVDLPEGFSYRSDTNDGWLQSVWATKTPIRMPSRESSDAIRSWVGTSRSGMPLSSSARKPSSCMNRSWSMGSSPAWWRNMPKWGA